MNWGKLDPLFTWVTEDRQWYLLNRDDSRSKNDTSWNSRHNFFNKRKELALYERNASKGVKTIEQATNLGPSSWLSRI